MAIFQAVNGQVVVYAEEARACTANKRVDEESTHIGAFQRTSPQVAAAERDGAEDMWKMASEQRTEPTGARHMAYGVRLRQVPPVIADRVWLSDLMRLLS